MNQRELPNPYQPLFRTLIITAFLLNIPAVVLLMSGFRSVTSMIGLIQFAMFGGGVLLLIRGKRIVRETYRLLNEPLLAQWTYSAYPWEHFSIEQDRRYRKLSVMVLVAGLFTGAAAGFAGIGGMSPNDGLMTGSILGGTALGVVLFHARSVSRRAARPPFEAFIGRTGAFVNGMLLRWHQSPLKLHSADLEGVFPQGPLMLVLHYSTPLLRNRDFRHIFIPVPEDRKKEAEHVVSVLTQYIEK